MTWSVGEIAAILGATGTLAALVAYAVRHGRTLQRVDALEERVKTCASKESVENAVTVLTERWADHLQRVEASFKDHETRTRALEAEVRRLEAELRAMNARAHWPADRSSGSSS